MNRPQGETKNHQSEQAEGRLCKESGFDYELSHTLDYLINSERKEVSHHQPPICQPPEGYTRVRFVIAIQEFQFD
jgi:hypothetical protein